MFCLFSNIVKSINLFKGGQILSLPYNAALGDVIEEENSPPLSR